MHCDGDFDNLHKIRIPSSDIKRKWKLAYGQCRQDHKVCIGAHYERVDHPHKFFEGFIQCCGRNMNIAADGKLSSQKDKGIDSVQKLFFEGNKFYHITHKLKIIVIQGTQMRLFFKSSPCFPVIVINYGQNKV